MNWNWSEEEEYTTAAMRSHRLIIYSISKTRGPFPYAVELVLKITEIIDQRSLLRALSQLSGQHLDEKKKKRLCDATKDKPF